MAKTSNIVILHYGDNKIDKWAIPIESSTVLAKADLVETDGSGNAQAVDSAETPTFLGVSDAYSGSGDTDDLPVVMKCIIKGKMAAGESATIGKAQKYSAGANGTDWTFASDTAEGIVWALETISTAGSGKLMVDVRRLDVGIFEVLTT